ncbi:hypothetical protein [Arthrobacter sp. MA-N2]|uniref:hypothetical protein n=1 Tax=Arthrobacter sp. MA-N2 TaxID=1101188 RepID=UPI000483C0FD|nr:hypothetical protein [Arthrobacter sp. MA-N2]
MTNDLLRAATAEAFPSRPRIGRGPVIDYERVRTLTENHRTAEQIAQILGCSTSAVTQIRRRLGITSPRMLTPERRQLIENAIRDGWSQIEICRTHHVDPETMRRHYPDAKWTQEQQNEHIRALRIGRTWNWGTNEKKAA